MGTIDLLQIFGADYWFNKSIILIQPDLIVETLTPWRHPYF